MAVNYRRIVKTVFLLLNIATAVCFLLACLASAVDPIKWWLVALLGLAFGFILAALVAFAFFWLLFRPRYVFISLVPLLIGFQSIGAFFAFRGTGRFNYQKPAATLRVAQWNVARFVEWRRNNNRGSQTRLKMMDQIKEQNADVLCLQEFFTSTDPQYYDNLGHVMKELGYSYHVYARTNDGDRQWFGNAIFSRLPIVDSGKLFFPHAKYPETLLHADIAMGPDTVRVYTTHLQSLRFNREDFENIEEIKKEQRDILQNSRGIFSKVRSALVLRKGQADLIKEVISNDPYPFVLTGDFNDVPNSYAYAAIRGSQLQDVFLKKGFGVGRTFNAISPTLRIDYVLATRHFAVTQFNRIARDLSDHYMLVADLRLLGKPNPQTP